jgi:hypothetical protein
MGHFESSQPCQCNRRRRLKPNVTYFATKNTDRAFDLYVLWAASFWFVAGKSSVAELPLNLTWNIYAFSGSFGAKNAPQDDSAF